MISASPTWPFHETYSVASKEEGGKDSVFREEDNAVAAGRVQTTDVSRISVRNSVGHVLTADGRDVPASSEAPMDFEVLRHLLENVLCGNDAFVHARHVIGLKLNT